MAGYKQPTDIIEFEKEFAFSFLEKVEKQAALMSTNADSGGAARGIASEE